MFAYLQRNTDDRIDCSNLSNSSDSFIIVGNPRVSFLLLILSYLISVSNDAAFRMFDSSIFRTMFSIPSFKRGSVFSSKSDIDLPFITKGWSLLFCSSLSRRNFVNLSFSITFFFPLLS